MEPEVLHYNGKRLRFVRTPRGKVKFYSDDFFNILGTGYPDDLVSGETVILDYEVAMVYANRNEEFSEWLSSQFNDEEQRDIIEGQ